MTDVYLLSKISQVEHELACLKQQLDTCCAAAVPTTCVPPSITSITANQSLDTGATLTLTVTATSDSPLTYQWKKDGVNIGGATSFTYTKANVNTGDSGSYSVAVTNSCSTLVSATIVVIVAIAPSLVTVYWWFGNSDPYTALQTTDTLTWTSGQIQHNDPVFADFRTASLTGVHFYAMKEPVAEDAKVSWINTGFNYGPIPDQAFKSSFILNGFRYYVSREPLGLFPEELTAFLSDNDELNTPLLP